MTTATVTVNNRDVTIEFVDSQLAVREPGDLITAMILSATPTPTPACDSTVVV